MSDNLRGIISRRISVRAYHLSEFVEKMNFLECGDKAIRSEILKLAPKQLQSWLEKEELLKFLYLHNLYHLDFMIGEGPFKNLQIVKSLVDKLSKVWKDIVEIELVVDHDKKGGKVRFKVVV